MGSLGILLAWVASVGLLALPTSSGGALDTGAASRLGLALLPWLALAGMPGRTPEGASTGPEGGSIPWWRGPLLALPPLALAAALDGEVAPAAAAALPLLVLLTVSAARGGALQAAGWLALVVLPPALATAFALSATAAGATPPAVEWLARRGPLGWAWEGARGTWGSPMFALGCGAGLVLLAELGRRRERPA